MISGNKVSMHQFLSLASVVQCESSGQKEDQAKIAGVFMNRLEKPMRLQSDVTVNYANQIKTVAVTYNHLSVIHISMKGYQSVQSVQFQQTLLKHV